MGPAGALIVDAFAVSKQGAAEVVQVPAACPGGDS